MGIIMQVVAGFLTLCAVGASCCAIPRHLCALRHAHTPTPPTPSAPPPPPPCDDALQMEHVFPLTTDLRRVQPACDAPQLL